MANDNVNYHISRISQNGSTTVAVIHIFVGGVTTEDEVIIPEGNIAPVTRYRNGACLTKPLGFTIEKSGTLSKAEMIPFLNAELAIRADALGLPPVKDQTNE
tara:strand:+ start:779 stop:1084 length:306 start_codon:yes stop_codon:yes gene_type:complete